MWFFGWMWLIGPVACFAHTHYLASHDDAIGFSSP